MNLLDANVWLAGVWQRHVHHERVVEWRTREPEPLGMCRVTQMALLRHITNPSIMGPDVLTRRDSWTVLTTLRSDSAVVWLDEPPDLEQLWRTLSARDDQDHKLWTDDYLAAFALGSGAALVTLDGAAATRYPSVHVVAI